MEKICLRGQFSFSQSKAEDGDTSPGSGTSDKSHEEIKHCWPSCQAVKGRHSNCKSSDEEEELWADLANQGKEAAGGAGPCRKSAESAVGITSFDQAAKKQVKIYRQNLEGGAGGKIFCNGRREWSWLIKAPHYRDNFR